MTNITVMTFGSEIKFNEIDFIIKDFGIGADGNMLMEIPSSLLREQQAEQ